MSYLSNRNSADKLIAKKGQEVALGLKGAGSYDAATSRYSSSPSSKTAKGVVLPLAHYRRVGDGGIVQGDETLLLSALDMDGAELAAPKVGSSVTLSDGTVMTLIAVDPLRPDGLNIMYDCVVRGSR